MARVEPLRPHQFPKEMRSALAALVPPEPRYPMPNAEWQPRPLGMLGTFAHHPRLARAFFTFNGQVLLATTLTPRQREILILRVAARRACAYLWAEHAHLAEEAGIAAEEVAGIASGPAESLFNQLDAALLSAVDEIVTDGLLTDGTWAVLAAEFDTQQMLDVIFTVGAYEAVSAMLRSFEIEPDGSPGP
ncbi:carboxymuconolactone decarboxylase family protein [Frankia sp. CNm7]|uniref:Carboxymuconolactone decarboxylase family protein n=1 Tax=Frankia nepalensis TaxID=1836974 RepID=A0A937UMX3_9ACTN|nr:carboxymuconolactone decarboxylase family protein [Frankia nepalensis]MBL7496520.1 carboxymuconolactone decarboxylase family protein [Frankia nepalensis]MBL7508739.1 carboxymuconolactone decarboxylase family protein [Frankia nepalensis]MBL7523798.1 carboxymuconolactone decarboxylase family protein [Frankia nepalensis]MBL7627493.1 carboxymuconolactone decarboxylase family protein [Frankia nepalensis]